MATDSRRGRVKSVFNRVGIDVEDVEHLFQYALIVFLGLATTIPLGILFLQSISDGSILQSLTFEVSFANFREAFSEPTFYDAIRNTAIFSAGSVGMAHLLGFTFAFILTRLEVPHSGKFHTLMFMPIFVSPLVLSLGFSFSFTRGGYYHWFFDKIGHTFQINNVWGMVFIGSIWLTPFAYSFLSAGLQNIDPEMEDAARITGAKDWKVLTNVSIPLLKPFALSSIFLTILLSFQSISIPAILGMPDQIYVLSTYLLGLESSTVPPPYGKMAAVGIVMVVFSLTIVFGISRLIGDVSKYTVITGRGRERTIHTSKPVQYGAAGFLTAYFILFLGVPLFQILSVGITEATNIAPITTLADISTTHFEALGDSDTFRLAIKNTVLIALITASVSVILTGVVAYIINRVEGLTSELLGGVAWIPISTPGVVLGLAYLWTVLVFDIGLYGTVTVLGVAFFVRFLALGVRMNTSLITQQAEELDEQAKICGASMFNRLGKIIFPNAKNGMMSVWVILFTIFMTELSTSIFLYTSSSRVITVTIFELWQTARYGALGALSIVQVLITFTVVFTMITVFDIDIRAV